jgi:uncharacterized protein YaaQ
MFSKIWTFLVGVEQRIEHDVEAIIADFTETVTKLEAAAEAKLAEAQELTRQSIELESAADVAHLASEKARAVAGKIKDLVS